MVPRVRRLLQSAVIIVDLGQRRRLFPAQISLSFLSVTVLVVGSVLLIHNLLRGILCGSVPSSLLAETDRVGPAIWSMDFSNVLLSRSDAQPFG